MNKRLSSLHSTFSINGEISNDNTRFLNITIDVMHTGLNLNGSYFDKDVVDSCIDSIKNTPVLGFIKYNKADDSIDFQGHEHILTKTENGIEEKYIGRAYGVIPESCNPRWITKMCSDGNEREFLQVDALLWEKFSDATSILYRDTEKAQSMELEILSVDGYEDENEVFHFTKFEFDGCCILGEGIEPAMIDANVAIKEVQFTMTDFVKNLQNELNDKFTTFTKMVNEKSNQGGIGIMPNTDFAQTVMEQFSDISTMVSQHEVMVDRWGDAVPRFYLLDIQDNEVIVVDRKDNYRYFGFPFTVNGDKAEIDFANGNRKKVRYENYEDGVAVPEGGFDFGKHIAEMEEAAFTKVNDANEKVTTAEADKATAEADKATAETNYSQIKADYDDIKPKYDAYVQADEQRQAAELDAQKDAKFAEYEDALAENADFTALKERKGELSVDDIEKECAVLYVKANRTKTNFSKTGSTAVVGVMDDGDVTDGFIQTKYGNIPVRR